MVTDAVLVVVLVDLVIRVRDKGRWPFPSRNLRKPRIGNGVVMMMMMMMTVLYISI